MYKTDKHLCGAYGQFLNKDMVHITIIAFYR